ncbi:hypothetical protein [Syntrophomonas wolfei]|uniref:hypothetical protein n=1 Tax=Syntrophomonas wolfei TaxID=863 RepID=UPI0023F3E140|nr:hypothetical protein [Syntrophomonas wolfei]
MDNSHITPLRNPSLTVLIMGSRSSTLGKGCEQENIQAIIEGTGYFQAYSFRGEAPENGRVKTGTATSDGREKADYKEYREAYENISKFSC